MIDAFGVSKGVPAGLPAAAKRGNKYAFKRLEAHTGGKSRSQGRRVNARIARDDTRVMMGDKRRWGYDTNKIAQADTMAMDRSGVRIKWQGEKP